MPKFVPRICIFLCLALLLSLASCTHSPTVDGGDITATGIISGEELAPGGAEKPPATPYASSRSSAAPSGIQTGMDQELSPYVAPSDNNVDSSTAPAPSRSDPPPPYPASPSLTEPSESPEPGIKVVTVRIEGPDGWLIENTELEFIEGITAADAISLACKDAGIELNVRGGGKTAYIVSIGGHAEKSAGALSGWIFKLNGVHSSVGVGAVDLSEGDRVSVYFSLDLGADAKDKE